MAHRRSNRQRNSWAVSLLEVQPTENVLEIGFGPGLAIAGLSRRAGEQGHVYGIDHSDVMLRQATRRNAAAIAAGRVTLARASVDQLPPALGGPFDAILAVNSLGLWPAPAERLGELRRRLRPGGRLAIASQPRRRGATASTSRTAARKIEALLQGAGYAKTRTRTLALNPPVVCVLAVTPAPVAAVARQRQTPHPEAGAVQEDTRHAIEVPCQSNKGEVVTKFRGNPWAVLLVVSLGFFMTLLDLTIVNIAIPDMIARLHASLDDVLWVINAYTLVLAVLLITAGRLGDLIGQRVMFIIGVALFTAASAACGLAPGPGWLIAFRAVQGLGAAVLIPQTLAILTMVFPPERRGAALGVWSAVGGVATIAGPTLGGLLVTAFGWRYIFFVNLPIGAAVIALAVAVIPQLHARRTHRLDLAGVLLASAALLGICYGLVEGQRYHWGTVRSFVSIPLVIGAGGVLLGVFLLVQAMRQDREPLIPFALFQDRNYTLMNWVAATVMIGMLGIFLPFTIYLQSVLGFSALKAGLTLAPATGITMFVAPGAGRLSDRIGGKYILITGLVLFASGMGWAALIATPSSAWHDFLPAFLVAGAGMGCVFPPMTTVAMRDIKPRVAGAAAGLLNTNRQIGSVIGTAAVGALLQNRLAAALPRQARQRSAGLPPPIRDKLVAGVTRAASSGAVGPGQSTSFHPQHGIPAPLARQVAQIYQASFTHGYVDAMRPAIVLPIAVLAVAALSCLAIKSGPAQPPQAGAEDDMKAPATAA